MAISIVQHGNFDGSTTAGAAIFTPGSNITAASLLVLANRLANGTGQSPGGTVADTLSNTWDPNGIVDVGGGFTLGIANAPNSASGADAITTTWAGTTSSTLRQIFMEIAGIAASSPLDASPAIATGSGTTATANTTGTLAQANEIAFLFLSGDGTGGTFSTPAGWTDSGEGMIASRIQMWYKIVAATTALAPASTLSSSQAWWMQIMTFKAAGGGGATFPFRNSRLDGLSRAGKQFNPSL